MKKILALLLCVTMCIGMFAGCGSKKESGSNESGDAASASATELKVAIGAQVTTLDPGLSTETVNNYILQHIAGHLFTIDNDNQPQPELADSYELSDDGLTYTIKLKDGLKWSDGEPLTANDFVYAVKRNLVYGGDNAWAIYYLQKYLVGADEPDVAGNADLSPDDVDIEGVKAEDDTTLVFTLSKPCSFFLRILTNNVFVPLRADVVDEHSSEWAVETDYPTSGPYKVSYVNENEKVEIVKNDNYFDAANITMDKITFMVMTDPDSEEAAFKTGEIDVALTVNATVTETYENQEDVWIIPSVSAYFVSLNSGSTGPEPLKDVNIRRALALSVNKEELCKNLGALYTELDGYVPHGIQGLEGKDFREEGDEQGTMLDYNLEEAKKLLADAGYSESNPLKLKYKYSATTLHQNVAQLLQQMWKEAGVDVELEQVESGVFYDQLDQGDFEMARYGYSSSTDSSSYLDIWTTSMQVVPSVEDEKFDQMIEDAASIVDPTEYNTAMHEAEKYLTEEMVYVIPLFDYNTAGLKNHSLQGLICGPAQSPFYGYCTFGGADAEAASETTTE